MCQPHALACISLQCPIPPKYFMFDRDEGHK